MLSIDVTKYVNEIDCHLFSDSIFHSGRDNIGEITWQNALQHVSVDSLVEAEDQDELRSWFQSFGCWTKEEIEALSDQETNALLLQFIAGDIIQMQDYNNIDEYYRAQTDGQCSSFLYCNFVNNKWYFEF